MHLILGSKERRNKDRKIKINKNAIKWKNDVTEWRYKITIFYKITIVLASVTASGVCVCVSVTGDGNMVYF